MSVPQIQIVPSVLPADFARLGEECQALEKAGVDRIQWDVMDGVFVPNLTVGPDVIAACRPLVDVPFEAHLMVVEPDELAHRYVEAGCEFVIVHAEACRHLHRTLGRIRDLGASPAVALNPATPAVAISHVLDLVDEILVMTVNPGFGGQSFIPGMLPKIAKARALVDAAMQRTGRAIWLEVDGGVKRDNARAIAAAGADTMVAGSAVFTGARDEAAYRGAIEGIRGEALRGQQSLLEPA